MKVTIIGGGSWGTALGAHLANKGLNPLIWAREKEVISKINNEHHNPKYLSSFKLPTNLIAVEDATKAIQESSIIVLALPSQAIREFLEKNKNSFKKEQIIVGASKGIECNSLKTINEIVEEILPKNLNIKYTCIAGPSFAKEVIEKQPTAVVIAGEDDKSTKEIQDLFHFDYFRAYRTKDVVGAELAGALKNVIAIAAGISDGLGFGLNTKAALITRGLSEILRIGIKKGALQETFLGLSGVGDLILTCYGGLSRNRTVGIRLGKGEKLQAILTSLGQVSEGVITSDSAFKLATKLGIDVPIFSEVYKVLYKEKPPLQSLKDLLERETRSETDG